MILFKIINIVDKDIFFISFDKNYFIILSVSEKIHDDKNHLYFTIDCKFE